MLKRNPALNDQHAWASRDSKNSHLALEAMIKQLESKEVTLDDCRPFFDMCQRADQKLLDIEAIIRREDASGNAGRYLNVPLRPNPHLR